jgi:hypothetical protein
MVKDIKVTEGEKKDFLRLIKDSIKKNYGDPGIQVYEKSIRMLKIGENPSNIEVEKLVSEIEISLARLYGDNISKPFCNELHKKLVEYDKFSPMFLQLMSGTLKKKEASPELKIKEELGRFFEKGIPDESDIIDLASLLVIKGIKQDKKQLIETLKYLSTEIITSDLNSNIIDIEIKYFLDKLPTYSETDSKDFINYMKINKINVSDEDIKEKIEKERLFRKFGYINEEEKSSEEKIRQYITTIFDKKKNYEYIKNNTIIQFAKKNIEKRN